MSRLRTGALAALLVLSLTPADSQVADEGPYANYLKDEFLTFSELRLNIATAVQALQADGVGRVWVGTNLGLSAVSGTALAPQFPLTGSDGLLSNSIRAIAFSKVGSDENFFLGFNGSGIVGIQYGRLLSETGVSFGDASPLLRTQTGDPSGVNVINDLSAPPAGNLWAATDGSLVRWDTGKEPPTSTSDSDLFPNTAVNTVPHVAADPWPAGTGTAATVYVVREGDDLLYTPASSAKFDTLVAASQGRVQALAFGGDHALWVATQDTLYKYSPPYSSTKATYSFSPLSALGADIVSLAVDPYSPGGPTVWVGTQENGAWFQQLDPSGGLSGSAWTQAPWVNSNAKARVYVDPSGNVWLGVDTKGASQGGVRPVLRHLLTLNSSRYVGYDAEATVSVVDVEAKGKGTVTASVNGSLDVTCTEIAGKPGQFTGSFGFSEGEQAGKVKVSGADDTEITVTYVSQGEGAQTLTALASWANIVDFEDDAWVGGFCFLRSLWR